MLLFTCVSSRRYWRVGAHSRGGRLLKVALDQGTAVLLTKFIISIGWNNFCTSFSRKCSKVIKMMSLRNDQDNWYKCTFLTKAGHHTLISKDFGMLIIAGIKSQYFGQFLTNISDKFVLNFLCFRNFFKICSNQLGYISKDNKISKIF